jgi:hypothetical protein
VVVEGKGRARTRTNHYVEVTYKTDSGEESYVGTVQYMFSIPHPLAAAAAAAGGQAAEGAAAEGDAAAGGDAAGHAAAGAPAVAGAARSTYAPLEVVLVDLYKPLKSDVDVIKVNKSTSSWWLYPVLLNAIEGKLIAADPSGGKMPLKRDGNAMPMYFTRFNPVEIVD